MKNNIKSFILGILVMCSYIFLSGQTYYKTYDVEAIVTKLSTLDLLTEEINEIKAYLKHGVKVGSGQIDTVNYPVRVDGGSIDRVNNSIDCICYDGKQGIK